MTTPAIVALIAAAIIIAVLVGLLVMRERSRYSRIGADRVRLPAEHVVDLVSTHDTDGMFRYVSPAFATMLGRPASELVAMNPREFAHPDDVHLLDAIWKRAVVWAGTPTVIIWRCRQANGELAWLETTARRVPGDAGDVGAIVCGSRDVTERKQIEDALRASENRFRSALETVRLVAVGLDTKGTITFANDALCNLLGWARSDLLGEPWFERCVPPDDSVRATFFTHIARGEIPTKYTHEVVCRDGSRRTIEWDNTLLKAHGEVVGTASLGADVTERQREGTELKLLQSITLAIGVAETLESALAVTLESLSDATGWGYGEAWLPAEDGMHLERRSHYSALGVDARPLIESGGDLRFASNEGLPGKAWESKSPVWVPDMSEYASKRLVDTAVPSGFRAAVALPVLAGRDVVAVLVFFMDRPRATDVRHSQMVFVVTNQVGAVIERRRAQMEYERELLRARDDAQSASRAKSDFLSRMSHELRTPLNSVIGFANVMQKNKAGRLTTDDVTYLERITANGQHLLTLVNNVLDIAKVEAGRMSVHTSPVAIDALLREVAAQLEGQPRSPGVQLRVDVPDGMQPIVSDDVLLRQVLINLVGNALRFTHEGSVILVADVDSAGVPTRIHVRDTGIGIARDRQRLIFEPFEQADSVTHRTYGGTGLGLSISKAICDALGYGLSVESDVGRGATFTIELTQADSRQTGVSAGDQTVPIPDTLAMSSAPHKPTQGQGT